MRSIQEMMVTVLSTNDGSIRPTLSATAGFNTIRTKASSSAGKDDNVITHDIAISNNVRTKKEGFPMKVITITLVLLVCGCASVIDPAVNSCLKAFVCGTNQNCVRACTADPYRRRAERASDKPSPPKPGETLYARRVYYLSACEIRRGGKLVKAFAINNWIRVSARDANDMYAIAHNHAQGKCTVQGGRMTSFKIEYILIDEW